MRQRNRAAGRTAPAGADVQAALEPVAIALYRARSSDEVLEVVAEASRSLAGAASGVAAVADGAGDIEIAQSFGYEGRSPDDLRPFLRAGLAQAREEAADGRAFFVRDRAELAARFRERRFPSEPVNHAWAATPVLLDGRVVGVAVLAFPHPRAFVPAERSLLGGLMRLWMHALERARLHDRLVREVEERKRAEAAWRESERSHRSLYANTPVMMQSIDPDGRIVNVSNAWLRALGYDLHEVLGLPLVDFLTEESRFYAQEVVFPEFFRLGACHDVPYRYVKRNGDVMDVRLSATAERDGAGTIVRSLAVLVDVTDRERARRELEEARRQMAMSEKLAALGTLVSGVAHEVRTPLAYVNNHAHLIQMRVDRALQDGSLDPAFAAQIREPAVAIAEGVDRIGRLVHDLRRFLRPGALEREPSALDEVVAGAVRLYQSTHPGAPLVLTRLESGAVLELDRVQTQQVVLNLLDNAADACRDGPITILTRPAGIGSELVVEDDGPGVGLDVRDRIFEPFVTTKPEGTGLGLSIVRRIAEAHGGSVRCEDRPHGGARFVVTFGA